MIGRAGQLAVGLLWWLCVSAVLLVVNFWGVIEHFLSLQSALIRTGTEAEPIEKIPIVGMYLASVFPRASLPQFIALSVAIVSALLFYVAVALIHGAIDESFAAREDAVRGDDVQARLRWHAVVRRLSYVALLAAPMFIAVRWELELLRVRILADALGIYDSAATAAVPAWPAVAARVHAETPARLASYGAGGYLAVVAGAAILFELAVSMTRERFVALLLELGVLWDSVSGRPADNDETVWAETDEAADGYAQPRVKGEVERLADGARAHATGSHDASPAPLFDPLPDDFPAAPTTATPEPPPAPEPREVIGGSAGESVTIADALRQPARYRVDAATGAVWSRPHWQALNGDA